LFFQPVKSFPLKRETQPLDGGTRAAPAMPRNSNAGRIAPIPFKVRLPVRLRESEGLAERNLSQIQ